MISQIKQQVTIQHIMYFAVITGITTIITGLLLLGNSYQNRMYPNTYINSIDVSGLSLGTAITILENHRKILDSHNFTLSVDNISLSSSSAELGYTTDFSKAANEIYIQQHNKSTFSNLLSALLSYMQKHELEAPKKYDEQKLAEFLEKFNQKVELIGHNPTVALKVTGSVNSIVVDSGKPGRKLNSVETTQKILEELQNEKFTVTAKIASTSSVLTNEEIEKTIEQATVFVSKKLTVKADDFKFFLDDKDLVSYLNPLGGYQKTKMNEAITEFSESVNRAPQNAVFTYDKDTLEVSEFVPNRDGLEVDIESSIQLIESWMNDVAQTAQIENKKTKNEAQKIEIPTSVQLVLKKTKPKITLDQTNDLGIKERIGFGESYYHHSITNRIHNVAITNEKVNLTIVKPGEEFSFNKTLGDVSKATGYRSAYVIQGGKTVLGDGGGVCQVSSTTFRAVLDAGLDITKRVQHAYRVSYYELNSDPGFDATVYSGDIDFRFKNDTDHHILLLYQNDPEKLHMTTEIYGTNDGRVSEVHSYKKWGATGPLPTEYFPTNELPTGVKKQIDWAVGGVKTEFTHTVKDKNGNIIHNDTYYSNYRPWSAKYMVGI